MSCVCVCVREREREREREAAETPKMPTLANFKVYGGLLTNVRVWGAVCRWCGQVFFNIDSFNPTVAVLTVLYSWAGLGIAIVNDFKSIEGDRELGLL